MNTITITAAKPSKEFSISNSEATVDININALEADTHNPTHSETAITPFRADLGDSNIPQTADFSMIIRIPTEEISPNRSQPRRKFDPEALEALAESIRTHGILQPITVQKLPIGSQYSTFKYELIAGERRLRASKLIGLEEIPAIILNISEQESAELAIIENLHRENLGIFEEAAAIAALIDLHSLTQEALAKQLSLTQSAIANKLRLLRLTDEEKALITSNNLTERHARALLKIQDIELRKSVLSHIIENSLNVTQTEEYIEKTTKPQADHSTGERSLRSCISSIQRLIRSIRSGGTDAKTSYSETDSELIYTITIKKPTKDTASSDTRDTQNAQ